MKQRGFKLFADGLLQGRTAFFTKLFLTPAPGCYHDCTGMPMVSQALIDASVLKGFRNNIQIYMHCNGHAASVRFIKAVEKGKLADFAILSADPTQINTAKIKDIGVLETIKEGNTIFER